MWTGKLSLVGVGPGDPDLLTRKAERVLREAHVVYHPGRDSETGFAARIAMGDLGPGAVLRAAAVEMQGPGDRYETLAREMVAEVRAGRRVAYITEGDPLVYSTASRLLERLGTGWPDLPVEIVPGVTSLTSAAAAAGGSLVRGAETLVVVPACHHADRIEELVEPHDRAVLLKLGGTFAQVASLAERRGWRAIYAERVGTPGERIVSNLREVDPRSVPYFSLVLIDKTSGRP